MKIGSVFSGIGAFEQAISRIGIQHTIVFACDNNKNVKKVYLENYDVGEYYDDIRDIDGKKYENDIDILVGGSPCQSFSLVGKGDGLDDKRGKLIFDYIDLVSTIKPKIFLFENVVGLTTMDNGKIWNIIKEKFEELGYNISYKILNARDYGIPQVRRRMYVVGILEKDVVFNFPLPIKLDSKMGDYLDKSVSSKYTLSEKMVAYVMASGTKNFYYKPDINLDIARPLLSSMNKMHRSGVDNYVDDNRGGIRRLTPRECLRLMGFPESYKLVCSDTQSYNQIGNSVVVDVLVAILQKLPIFKLIK